MMPGAAGVFVASTHRPTAQHSSAHRLSILLLTCLHYSAEQTMNLSEWST